MDVGMEEREDRSLKWSVDDKEEDGPWGPRAERASHDDMLQVEGCKDGRAPAIMITCKLVEKGKEARQP